MKNTKILLSLAVCGVALATASTTAYAAPEVRPDVPTKGAINWVPDDNNPGEVIKPELPGVVIEPGGGGATAGTLRIQHVPDFDFGDQFIKTGEQLFNPLLESYQFKEADAQEHAEVGKDYYIPHFIQVTDERGTNKGWNLTVKATKFTHTDPANSTEVLENTTMTLNKGARLSNTNFDETEIANRVSFYGGAETLTIPTDDNAIKVLATKGEDKDFTTNGSQTSLVLNKDYDKGNLDYKATDTNNGVTFTKPNKDVAILGVYESTITWTLTDGM